MFSRVRSTVRTKGDFESAEKFRIKGKPKHVPEGLSLEEEVKAAENPYRSNRPLRQRTTGAFMSESKVARLMG